MKSEIETLIQAGRKLVENNAVSEPEDFSNRLDVLKSLYNKVSWLHFVHEYVSRVLLIPSSEVSPRNNYRTLWKIIPLFSPQLGAEIVDAKTCIETALDLSKNLQSDVAALHKWMDSVEGEMDRLEVAPDEDRDVDIELAFVAVRCTNSPDSFA